MSAASESEHHALLKRALVEIRAQRERIRSLERNRSEPIAVVGLGCRFPGGGDTPEAFWSLQCDAVDTVGETPSDRFDTDALFDSDPDRAGRLYTRAGSFLADVRGFDARFFGIPGAEAAAMDPQHRLLLEVAWEALEHGGIAPRDLSGTRTGVFVGVMNQDYAQLATGSLAAIDGYTAAGAGIGVAAGRLAHTFGLSGPTLALDTNCSSSLVAVHLACQSLRAGECEMALAAGVNLMLTPVMQVVMCRAHALAPDGRCKTFDASADGYGRGEGAGVVVLQRLSDALASKHRILALVRGSAVNHDGRSSALPVPNGLAQRRVILDALERAQVDARDVGYVEAHGTGTRLGDPIELEALAEVYGEGRTPDDPLRVGSIKTNIGHLEGAAGIAAMIRTVQILEHGEIPPHLHLRDPNPMVPWDKIPIEVPTRRTPWPRGERPRIAGVSAFGFSGTNAHVVLEEAQPANARSGEPTRARHLLVLSARSDAALAALCLAYAESLEAAEQRLADVCFTANAGRSHFAHRVACVGSSHAELATTLRRLAATKDARTRTSRPPRVLFVCGEASPAACDAAWDLVATEPLLLPFLARADAWLEARVEATLATLLREPPGGGPGRAAWCAFQWLLAESLRGLRVEPDAVLCLGAGAPAAACIAGVLELEDALALALEPAGVPAEEHHPEAEGAARSATAGATSLEHRAPAVRLLSVAAGSVTSYGSADLEAWRKRVRWERGASREAAGALPADLDVDAVLELGDGSRASRLPDAGLVRLPLLEARGSGLLEAVAGLYRAGCDIDFGALADEGTVRVVLPRYPFERRVHWLARGLSEPTARRDDEERAGREAESSRVAAWLSRAGALPRAPAREQVLARLLALARTVIDLEPDDPLETDRSLLDQGLDSLMAVELRSQIEAETGVALESGIALEHPTLEEIADALIERSGDHAAAAAGAGRDADSARGPTSAPESPPAGSLVRIQAGAGGRPPLVLVHPIGGSVLCYVALARALGPDVGVLGIEASERGPSGADLDDLARAYVDLLRRERPEGPYLLAGWSLGGFLAFEMARRLRRAGESVPLALTIDSVGLPLASRAAREACDESTPALALFALDLGIELSAAAPGLAGVEPDVALERLAALGRAQSVLPASIGTDTLRARYQIFRRNLAALERYSPKRLDGSLTCICAGDAMAPGAPSGVEPDWSSLADEVRRHELPGDHFSLMRPPRLRALARILSDELDRALGREEGRP